MGPLEAGRAEPLVTGNLVPRPPPLPLRGGEDGEGLLSALPAGFIRGSAPCPTDLYPGTCHQRRPSGNHRKALVPKAMRAPWREATTSGARLGWAGLTFEARGGDSRPVLATKR